MKTQPVRANSIRQAVEAESSLSSRFLYGERVSISISELLNGTCLGGDRSEFAGRSVLINVQDQFAAALAIIELDGIARRLVICPPDLAPEYLPEVIKKADVDAIAQASTDLRPSPPIDLASIATEWVLLTSGTTGAPKMLRHSFAGLTAAIKPGRHDGTDVVWGTFYDIRRYGGLQILLRALLGRGSFVFSSKEESANDHLLRLAARSVTHLTGTPSHWRRALMSPAAHSIAPRYVRLSGEIADQAILNTLRAFYPEAAIGHAFASTEAGVAFEVNDGFEGFPAGFVGASGEVNMKIENGSLRIRSSRTAASYVGETSPLHDADGFVDTGDMIEQRGERCYFLGRRSGVINVGGLKVYPEEIEALLNRHPAVRMSRVRSRRNPITGSLVVADVVLKDEPDSGMPETVELERQILQVCREALPRHKVPAALHFVPALSVAATGKMTRQNA